MRALLLSPVACSDRVPSVSRICAEVASCQAYYFSHETEAFYGEDAGLSHKSLGGDQPKLASSEDLDT